MSGDAIHRFVVGTADATALTRVGIEIEFESSGITMSDPTTGTVRPSVKDVATGFVASAARGKDALQEWAQIILALGAVDLSALEDAPGGEALLEAVWDAAKGDPSGVPVATRLATG